MDKFHRLVLEEFKDWHRSSVWTYVLANGLWREQRQRLMELARNNRATLTAAVLRACQQLLRDGFLTGRAPRWRGDKWEFSLTDAGRDELDENNTHCLLCEKLIKPGDLCHRCAGMSDGVVACEECAPTWEDTRVPDFLVDRETGDPVPPEEIEADIANHLAAGGKLTDKLVEPY